MESSDEFMILFEDHETNTPEKVILPANHVKELKKQRLNQYSLSADNLDLFDKKRLWVTDEEVERPYRSSVSLPSFEDLVYPNKSCPSFQIIRSFRSLTDDAWAAANWKDLKKNLKSKSENFMEIESPFSKTKGFPTLSCNDDCFIDFRAEFIHVENNIRDYVNTLSINDDLKKYLEVKSSDLINEINDLKHKFHLNLQVTDLDEVSEDGQDANVREPSQIESAEIFPSTSGLTSRNNDESKNEEKFKVYIYSDFKTVLYCKTDGNEDRKE